MIRIDKRKNPDDGLLICTDKFQWRKKTGFTSPPNPSVYNHKILIESNGNSFKFEVDGSELTLQTDSWDYTPNNKIGFFNEIRQVKIEKLKINIF